MKKIEISPKAHEDMEALINYLSAEFSVVTAQKIVGEIYDDMEKLSSFPDLGVDIFRQYEIVCDYLCMISHKNYIFYRIEENDIKIIRIIDERKDFLRALFGKSSTSKEDEDYWDESS